MDITKALAPKSDQKNADDFLSGPQTFAVESVTEGTEEQPVNINLVGHPGKPYKPSKSMLRVLAKLWGTSGADWAGRSLTLYTDPTVKFGGVTLGGIKISHMSHIAKREQVSLTVTRGKKGTHTVEPLIEKQPAQPARNLLQEANAAGDNIAALRTLYNAAQQAGEPADTLAAIKALATPTAPTEGQ